MYVERSVKNADFQEIASLNDLKAGQNRFVDKYPVYEQEMYYRIKSIYKDGNITYSSTKTAILDKESVNTFLIYPNPARYTDNLTLKYEGNNENILSIGITDMSGKTLYYEENTATLIDNSQIRIPVQLHSGCYGITVRFLDKTVTQKLIIY